MTAAVIPFPRQERRYRPNIEGALAVVAQADSPEALLAMAEANLRFVHDLRELMTPRETPHTYQAVLNTIAVAYCALHALLRWEDLPHRGIST